MTNIPVMDLNGSKSGEVALPLQFSESIRPDLIKRAFHAAASQHLQPKGAFRRAGLQTSAAYFGRRHRPRSSINVGRSRLPREKLAGLRLGRVRIVPHSVKGRRAHPPKPEKTLVEKINLKERSKAVRSAIAATAHKELVKARGHLFDGTVPLVVNSGFESLKKTKEVEAALQKLGAGKDLHRTASKRRPHGKRKAGMRSPRSVLIVYAHDGGIAKASRSLPGVDVVQVGKLDAEVLAPGGVAGRLTVWTRDALEEMQAKKLYLPA